jgi:hypothetical protein
MRPSTNVPVIAKLAAATLLTALSASCSSSPSSSATNASATPIFTMTVHVPASTEAFQCKYVTMPSSRSFVTSLGHTFTEGSHHLVIFRTDQSAIPAGQDMPTPCYESGSDFMSHVRGMIYTAQVPTQDDPMPPGVGFAFEPSEVLLIQTHYVNASAHDLDAKVDVRMTMSDGSNVQQKAGTMFIYDPFVFVPKGGKARAGMRCGVEKDVKVLRIFAHTHARGTQFQAFIDPASGEHTPQPFYTSNDWAHPTASPPTFDLAGGSKLRFTCDYDNTRGDADFYQGQSASTNEMCALAVTYYPELGLDQDYCISGGDDVGFGSTACGDTMKCEQACPEQHSKDVVGVPECIQKCVVASCGAVSAQIAPVHACAKTSCAAECQTGGATCSDCVNAKCASDVAACTGARCAP